MFSLQDLATFVFVFGYAGGFAILIYELSPIAWQLLSVALFLLVWYRAFRLVDSRSAGEFILSICFFLDMFALVCSLCAGGSSVLRVVLSLGFLALHALSRLS